MIVVDTNVIAYLLVPGPHTASAQATLRRDPLWAAPVFWRSELRNVLVQYMRLRQMPLTKAVEIQGLAEAIFTGREYPVDSTQVLQTTATSGCSAYDCEFVSLARSLGVPLITNDNQVLRAFPDIAVSPSNFVGA